MVLASALCFGSYGVWSRLLGHSFGIFYQGWVRSALILTILLPVSLLRGALKPVAREHRPWFAVTMVFTVATQVPLYFAFNHLPLGTATLLFYALFLITSYIVGWLFLDETVTAPKCVSLVLALTGLLLSFGLSLNIFSLSGMLLAGLNGIASGGEVATSKKSSAHYSSLQITTYSWMLILVTHLPLSVITGERQMIPAFNGEWLAMVGYAAAGLGGFLLVIEGFKYIDAGIGGLIGLLEIVFSVCFGIVFFRDHLTSAVVAGGVLILAAAVLPDLIVLMHGTGETTPSPEQL